MADNNYFRITSLEDENTVSIRVSGSTSRNLEYSVDDGNTW